MKTKKTISIPLPRIEGLELKDARVALEKAVVIAEYEEEDIVKDISEIAVDFGSAVVYLDEAIHEPTVQTTDKNMSKLDAFNKLIILAEAWNMFDEFKPDWEDRLQDKHYPLFEFIDGKFEFSSAVFTRFISDPHTSNFSFKTPERAEQFGKQFIDLFRIVLTNE